MCTILYIFNNLHIIDHLQIISIQSLAADIADAHKNVLALLGMSDPTDELRLAIRERHILLLSHVVESYAAHRAPVAYVPP
jgi:DNA-binding IclR family transcriptional regulator